MIIKAVIGNKQHPEYGVMSAPFPIPPEEYDNIINMLEQLEIGDVLNADCHMAEIDNTTPVLKQLEDTEVNINELNYLAKILDSFSENELAQFQAMAVKNGYCKVPDLINLTDCRQQTTDMTAKTICNDVPVRNLGDYLRNVDMEKGDNQAKFNELTKRVKAMDEAGAKKFAGMLDANSINGIDDILRLTESVGEYTVLPEVYSDRTLGEYVAAHSDWDIPESVKPYLDHVYIGGEFYAEHGGAYTPDGYVVRKDELPWDDRPVIARTSYASGEVIEHRNKDTFLKELREELEYHNTSGFNYELLTDDPELRKAVDDELYNLFGEVNPRGMEEYEQRPVQDMTMGGM